MPSDTQFYGGYQIDPVVVLDVPASWQLEIGGQPAINGPYTLRVDEVASVFPPNACRPLPELRTPPTPATRLTASYVRMLLRLPPQVTLYGTLNEVFVSGYDGTFKPGVHYFVDRLGQVYVDWVPVPDSTTLAGDLLFEYPGNFKPFDLSPQDVARLPADVVINRASGVGHNPEYTYLTPDELVAHLNAGDFPGGIDDIVLSLPVGGDL